MIFASGLKYVGVGTTALGWVLCSVLLVAGGIWFVRARPWQKDTPAAVQRGEDEEMSAVSSGPD